MVNEQIKHLWTKMLLLDVPFECGIMKEIQSMIQLSTLNTYDLPIVLNRQKKNITKEKFMIQWF